MAKLAIEASVTPLKDLGYCKCPRCAKYTPSDLNYDRLCNRCLYVLVTYYPNHESVSNILENLKLRGLTIEQCPMSE